MDTKGHKILNAFIKEEITNFFEKVLDFAEVAIAEKNQYKAFRAKVLRLGNNAIRACSKEVEMNYRIMYDPSDNLPRIIDKLVLKEPELTE